MKNKKWTDAEIRHLNVRMDTTNIKIIAEEMDRTVPSVYQKARQIRMGEVAVTMAPVVNNGKPKMIEADVKTFTTKKKRAKRKQKIRIRRGESRHNKKWSNDEIIFISQTLNKKPEWVARKMKRTVGSVIAARYGLEARTLHVSLDRDAIIIEKWWKRIFKKR